MEKRILRVYFLVSFLFAVAVSFFFATYVVFLTSRGLDLLEVNLINTVFVVGIFILEIPTGAYADLIGRKKSFVLGCFFLSVSMLIYYLSSSFWMFMAAELVGAVAMAFRSGALESWLVDSLKFHGFDGDLVNVFKKEQQLDSLGIVVGALAGGYIAKIDVALPWLASAIAVAFVGVFCSIAMTEEYFDKTDEKLKLTSFKKIINESIFYGINKKSVFFIIIFGIVFAFICQGPNMQWQIKFKDDFRMDTAALGWIFVGISACVFIGSHISGWFAGMFRSEKGAIVFSQVFVVIGLMSASLFVSFPIVLSGFFIHEIGRGIVAPLVRSYTNNRIPSEQRATIISFKSMMAQIGSVMGLVISGYLAKNYSISTAWIVSAVILVVSIPILLKFKNGE